LSSGLPTNTTGRPAIPLATPAADAYHATAAVTTPMIPDAFTIFVLLENFPMKSTTSVAWSVKNTPKTARLIWVHQIDPCASDRGYGVVMHRVRGETPGIVPHGPPAQPAIRR
jgi:hypothetical protein